MKLTVGVTVGISVGISVGFSVGLKVGTSVGLAVGISVGLSVGYDVGGSVIIGQLTATVWVPLLDILIISFRPHGVPSNSTNTGCLVSKELMDFRMPSDNFCDIAEAQAFDIRITSALDR